ITVCTTQRWLRKLDWQYWQKSNGMYIDGYEHDDVIEYQSTFIKRWAEYEKHMVTYDNDGNIKGLQSLRSILQLSFLYLVTHDESTFYANDHCKTKWIHSSEKSAPQRKGEGALLMVSDF
ncbi:hypothetical protein WOLCODRAFT_85055, partial [Wolfiporia cocos MD-104 SS10]